MDLPPIREWPAWAHWAAGVLAALGLALAGVVAAVEDTPQPSPAAVPSVPAPLPPGTGIDLDGAGALLLAEPDPGPGADTATAPPASDGVGGEVFVRSPAFAGAQRLNAGAYYSNGAAHWAWDVGIWRGTKVFAARPGVIVGANDGVPNHPSGAQYAVAGSPSNWVLLCSRLRGRDAVLYYQHLSPGLAVRPGQRVAAGKALGRSGNTGASTGDHLHLAAGWLRAGQTCSGLSRRTADRQRYDYLNIPGLRLFAPAKFWAQPAQTVTLAKSRKVAWLARRHGVKPWRVCKLNPAIRPCSARKRLPAGAVVRLR